MQESEPERASVSRRRFIQLSVATVGGLSVSGLLWHSTAYAVTAPVTTLAQVLEAAPVALADQSSPQVLLKLAQQRGKAPEELADSLGLEIGDDGRILLQILDRQFPYQTPFGQQPLSSRQAALEWAERQRAQLPDLGSRRDGVATPSTASDNTDPSSPDEPWRLVAVALLQYAGGVGRALTVSAAQQPGSPESGATTLIRPDDAAALKEP